jgi:hypothetical protein
MSVDVGFCVGFRPPVITELSSHCCGRRLKSAKARNRGGGRYEAVPRAMGI